MNLMVVLVPFLLITAVFSRVTVLELNLPVSGESEQPPQEQPLQLEIIVRETGLHVAYHGGARVATVDKVDGAHDLARLAELLQQVKAAFPEEESATILLEPEVPYDVLVQVMDVARVRTREVDGTLSAVELFPQIAIGDAPAAPAEG